MCICSECQYLHFDVTQIHLGSVKIEVPFDRDRIYCKLIQNSTTNILACKDFKSFTCLATCWVEILQKPPPHPSVSVVWYWLQIRGDGKPQMKVTAPTELCIRKPQEIAIWIHVSGYNLHHSTLIGVFSFQTMTSDHGEILRRGQSPP